MRESWPSTQKVLPEYEGAPGWAGIAGAELYRSIPGRSPKDGRRAVYDHVRGPGVGLFEADLERMATQESRELRDEELRAKYGRGLESVYWSDEEIEM